MLEITVGKKYVGEVGIPVTIVRQNRQPPYQYFGENKEKGYKNTFSKNGESLKIKSTRHNLIKQYIEQKPLHLEVGKKYITGSGEIVTINSKLNGAAYPFIGNGSMGNISFTKNGKYHVAETSHPYNLMEEYIEKIKPLQLEVGKTYINRSGAKVTIASNGPCDNYPFKDNNGNSYTRNGHHYFSETSHPNDLMEEYIEPIPTKEEAVGKYFQDTSNNHLYRCLGVVKFVDIDLVEKITSYKFENITNKLGGVSDFENIPSNFILVKDVTEVEYGKVFVSSGVKYVVIKDEGLYKFVRSDLVKVDGEGFVISRNYIFKI